ncbi:uncharacterized protein CMC5_033160 [Chondromyces crocatus]|uniref:Uncharacterized protein n=2 Tax=Chondromyces crocatus TaxID=52 RepID=A0A0K1EE94_CHOCO|nr:uncharacterized protein CMC5_033160 [Chondromyces crocatus]
MRMQGGEAGSWPERLPYKKGTAIPPGYTLKTRTRLGLVIAGAVTFGTAYAASVATAVVGTAQGSTELIPLLVPVVGPMITIPTYYLAESRDDGGTAVGVLMLDALVQSGGLVLLMAGLRFKKKELVRKDVGLSHVEVTPMPMGVGGLGLGVMGSM